MMCTHMQCAHICNVHIYAMCTYMQCALVQCAHICNVYLQSNVTPKKCSALNCAALQNKHAPFAWGPSIWLMHWDIWKRGGLSKPQKVWMITGPCIQITVTMLGNRKRLTLRKSLGNPRQMLGRPKCIGFQFEGEEKEQQLSVFTPLGSSLPPNALTILEGFSQIHTKYRNTQLF